MRKLSRGKLFIGTSGWAYPDWQNFYPQGLKSRDCLKYYSRKFPTVELNYSFYHLPKPSSYEKWTNETPADFQLALKLSRFITHIKRLSGVKEALQKFLTNALVLGEKLGPILIQLPPNFKADSRRLEQFLKTTQLITKNLKPKRQLRLAFEFRHQSWFSAEGARLPDGQGSPSEADAPLKHASHGESQEVLKILKKYKAALVFAHSRGYPYPEKEPVTAQFIYLRFHGPKELFASFYGREELKTWAAKIKKWLKSGLDVYAYFNNDIHGYAIDDGKTLRKLCEDYIGS